MAASAIALPAMPACGAGAGFSIASDHDGCAGPGRRRDGYARAHRRRGHVGVARPAGHHRERDRRVRRHRRRPGGTRGARRLHAQLRGLRHACRQRRDHDTALRRDCGFRAGCVDLGHAVADRRQERSAGQRSQGPRRLAQGQSGQGFARHRRRRQPVAHRRASCCRTSPARAFSLCPIAAPRR